MTGPDRLERDLIALEGDHSLFHGANWGARFHALKSLDFMEESFRMRERRRSDASRLARVRALRTGLELCNETLFGALRADIRSGRLAGRRLRELLEECNGCRPRLRERLHWGADPADQVAAGLFQSDRPPQPWNGGDGEMIHYESTPVSALLEMVERVPFTDSDRFVDIGAGLGQVVMLVHLLNGVAAVGLEVNPSYVAHARAQAAALGIGGVRFKLGDARTADLCSGTVYFLFSPFRGQMLRAVLGRLREETAKRPVTICSFGPCTAQLAGESWLLPLEAGMNHEFRLAIFHSRGEILPRRETPARA